jgi:hypothetical protein
MYICIGPCRSWSSGCEAVCSSETVVSKYESTRRYYSEDQHRHLHRREKQISYRSVYSVPIFSKKNFGRMPNCKKLAREHTVIDQVSHVRKSLETPGLLHRYWLHGSKSILSLSEESSPCSQEPATGPYPEAHESSPRPSILFIMHFNIILHSAAKFSEVSSLQIFRLKFSSLPCVVRAPPILLSLIW